jgi:chloramphenicol-sensitive protein RarD
MAASDPPADSAARGADARFREGLAATLGAFIIWGLLPLYLRLLDSVSPAEIMAHRIVWSFVLVFAWLAWRGDMGAVRDALRDRHVRMLLAASAVLISINWLVYLWSVATDHVLDASLGYFMNPLLNVALGVLVLSERLNRPQWVAIALAAAGVIYLTIATGKLPWIALTLAVSFALYGLIRKLIKVEATPGLGIETLLLLPFALAYLGWLEVRGVGALGHTAVDINLLLLGTGIVTAVPLALFAHGARLIPLSTVGLIQYVGPSLQLLVGVFVFHEAFTPARAVAFGCIWTALAIYMIDSLRRNRAAVALARNYATDKGPGQTQ